MQGLTRRLVLGALMASSALTLPVAAKAEEVTEISLARQFGLHYLPMILMEKHQLIEKHAAAAGIPLKASWKQFSGGASVNEALVSGALDVVAGGTGPLVVIWDKTVTNMGVKGFAAVSEVPMVLLSRNPAFKTLADMGPTDRVALPAVNTSMQAITLQMAAAKMFGKEDYKHFDPQTVSMPHPDGVAAMLSGKLEVNAHFTAPPYSYAELKDPAVHRVMSSFDVYGGPATLIVIYGTTAFYEQNPTVVKVMIAALKEATDMANADRRKALGEYMEVTGEKMDADMIERFVADEEINFDVTPRGMQQVGEFLADVGASKHRPEKWQDMFFPPIHDLPGS